MQFDLEDAASILSRTPAAVRAMLHDLPDAWVRGNEGGESWSPFDILGHLIHGERSDWIPRARTILEHGESREFEPFDRFAQFRTSEGNTVEGKTVDELFDEFAALRRENLATLRDMDVTAEKLELTGRHPDFGRVTLRQLLSTWVAHDLGHLRQIARVMAKQYADEVGPWREYLPVVSE